MTGRLYLFGHPVAHSLSPAMHRAAIARLGLDLTYDALDLVPAPSRASAPAGAAAQPPRTLADGIALLRAPDGLGANCTVPLKEAVIPLLDGLDPGAAAIGAVNTIVKRAGRLIGHNTDAPGFRAALAEEGIDPAGLSVLVLGAGGAARAVVAALAGLAAPVRRLTIANRSVERAERLVAELVAPGVAAEIVPLAPRLVAERLAACDLLVNTTSVGLERDETPLPDVPFPSRLVVYDLIYNPLQTRLLRDAAAAGARAINGLGMLVHQAALAFELWTGRRPPIEVMRAVAHRGMRAAESVRPAEEPGAGRGR